jgi:hypothetical protein
LPQTVRKVKNISSGQFVTSRIWAG